MARIMAIDYGSKRTGIAATDELQMIASGLTTVATSNLLTFLIDYCEKEKVALILVGEPKQKDGNHSDIEKEIRKFLEKLSKAIPEVAIERIDERYSSKMAFQSMIDSGLKKKKRRDKALIDEISATILLQDYLYRK